jgi:hypothetical protein
VFNYSPISWDKYNANSEDGLTELRFECRAGHVERGFVPIFHQYSGTGLSPTDCLVFNYSSISWDKTKYNDNREDDLKELRPECQAGHVAI